MTIEEHLIDRANAYIAKELWQKISTELDASVGKRILTSEKERFTYIKKRVTELLKEYIMETPKPGRPKKDDKKIED